MKASSFGSTSPVIHEFVEDDVTPRFKASSESGVVVEALAFHDLAPSTM